MLHSMCNYSVIDTVSSNVNTFHITADITACYNVILDIKL